MKIVYALLALFIAAYGLLVFNVYRNQTSILYAPTSETVVKSSLLAWNHGGRTLGYAREIPQPRTIWLMCHGNAGQAEHRDYILPLLDPTDSLYVLEYPGFGVREGKPSRESLNTAAAEAYRLLRTQNPGTPVCVIGESIGSGPACELARETAPPDKIILLTPFDTLANTAAGHFRLLPVRYLLRDDWDNIASLRDYRGPVEIYAALEDTVVPYKRAQALATAHPGAILRTMLGGHNDWVRQNQVRLTR